jgi:outer membrane lipoprotein SlyB
MRTLLKITLLTATLSLTACANSYYSHQPYPQQSHDTDRSYQNTMAGAAIGAATGAVIGHQLDHKSGRYVGAAAGALIGGAIGNSMDKEQQTSRYEDDYYERQRRYEWERRQGYPPPPNDYYGNDPYGENDSPRSYPYRGY